MLYKERYKEIVDLLACKKRITVAQLSTRFRVSDVTIRKDLATLETMGLLRRFHSGALAVDNALDIPVHRKQLQNREDKQRIAGCAATMVKEGMSVLLDAGTTVHQIACRLHGRTMKVVTNSLIAGNELADEPSIELHLTGGTVRPSSRALVGPTAEATIEKMHVDIAFIGAIGITPEKGFTSASLHEARMKELMLKCASRRIIVADHTKIGTVAFAPFGALNSADVLITDCNAPDVIIRELRDRGLDVVLAE